MKKVLFCAILFALFAGPAQAQHKVSLRHYKAAANYISNEGLLSEKILLHGNSTPQVSLKNIVTEIVEQAPASYRISGSFEPDVLLAVESKRQIAYVQIPAYRILQGRLEKLISCDIESTELDDGSEGTVAMKPTTVPNSILASGTWFKIGAPSRGIYKIDYAFLQSIGLNPGAINPANIRLYGNGGTVLSERVSSDQPDDLIENAIFVSTAGSNFGADDYILFYANGTTLWNKDSLGKSFTHTSNYYENLSYYFLNVDLGPGMRITQEAATGAGSYPVSSFDDYMLIERDSINVGNMGKVWWGAKMNTVNPASLTQNFAVNLGSIIDSVKLKTYVCHANDDGGNMLVSYDGNSRNLVLDARGSLEVATPNSMETAFKPGNAVFNVSYQYSTGGSGTAYVDYLRFNYRRPLIFTDGQLQFRDWNTAALPAGEMASYTLQNVNTSLKVWEITNPLEPVALNGTAGAGTYTIVRSGHRLREFIAFDGTYFHIPVKLAVSAVPNQDLHGLDQVDFLIVTPEAFKASADELAAFHQEKDGIKVAVAVTDQIYNEFSSGGQDISGIRNFIKMFYDRPGQPALRNVLFMGAASFDYKNRIAFNTNFVPTYQTYQSLNGYVAYSSDDFFALLDDGEDINSDTARAVDLGIGRIPAFTAQEAADAIAKIKRYASPASFGPWKNIVSYVADDIDEDKSINHLPDCELVAGFYDDSVHMANVYKIYGDAYTSVSTPGGTRYPMVNKAINDQIYNGTFLMSYSGHGSPTRWAHEAILTADDYGNWKNKNKLPVMVTATCDFGRFDDPENRSAGARLMIAANNGAIAMITTTQMVYASENFKLSRAYASTQFLKDSDGNWRTLGQALKEAKTRSISKNNYKYAVLGDPALNMQMPVHQVVTDSLVTQGGGGVQHTDTIKALGRYVLSGSVKNAAGHVISNFNGPVYVTIFDKRRKIQTVNPLQTETPFFSQQTSIVAKVKGTVKNGRFSVTFVVPKDINYEYGAGKISYYANNETVDAAGVDMSFTVGDYNRNASADNDAPIVKPYIDNDKFRDGGVTGPNPLLYVKLFDENGINVSGSSIGHDLVAILDDDQQNPYVMNSYYETEQNDFRQGYVNFPMYNLPDGTHTLRVKAWDAYNNSGEGVVTFEVKNKDKGFISDLYNYPNPVTDMTHIVFQHNQEGEPMSVTVQLYSAAGQLVRTIKQDMTTSGNRTEILWDGLGENGAQLFRGVYFYRLVAKTSKGISATAYNKLVLLRR